jgi:hypothetical protein
MKAHTSVRAVRFYCTWSSPCFLYIAFAGNVDRKWHFPASCWNCQALSFSYTSQVSIHKNSKAVCSSRSCREPGSDSCLQRTVYNRICSSYDLLLLLGGNWSRVSSGSIVSDYGLDDRAIGVRSPAGSKDFSSNLCVQTGSGAHQPPVQWVPGVLSPGVKRGRGVTLTTHPI